MSKNPTKHTRKSDSKPSGELPRFSANDKAVLAQLRAEAGQPVSAYDLMTKLRDHGIRYPVTVYRALDKLIAAGLVHRIETSNAFIACSETCDSHQPLFAVCGDCGRATEFHTDDAVHVLEQAVSKLGFEVSQMNLELKGTCFDCKTAATAPSGGA